MDRKKFIKTSALVGLTSIGMLNGCQSKNETQNESENLKKKYNWKMVTTWPPNFPVLGEACNQFAQLVQDMSAGQMNIKVYGSGELIPALEVFDAVSSGAAEIGNGAAYYWAGKNASTQFFTTIPFGMNAQQMNAWLYSGGGLELWRELYAKFGLVPFPGGTTGMQMGGWFNKEIKTMEDFKGLKMRIPGLGGKVLNNAGGTAVLTSASEIYTNLERGVIDAAEWVGPYHDYLMGFQHIAKYYYAPGWQEFSSTLEYMFNKKAFEGLPKHLQIILETATYKMNAWVLVELETKNAVYLQKIITENKVQVKTFSPEILQSLRELSEKILSDLADEDPICKKIYTSYLEYKMEMKQWAEISEKFYYNNQ